MAVAHDLPQLLAPCEQLTVYMAMYFVLGVRNDSDLLDTLCREVWDKRLDNSVGRGDSDGKACKEGAWKNSRIHDPADDA